MKGGALVAGSSGRSQIRENRRGTAEAAEMTLYAFGRFHVGEGNESAFEEALREVLPPSRAEAGCQEIHGYLSLRDARMFYVHSRWRDEEAFDAHAKLPHTLNFLKRVEGLLDQPLDFTRTERIL
jgi:quinol monooxygenase YgiN